MRFTGWALLVGAVLVASYGVLGLPREGLVANLAGCLYTAAREYPILAVLFGLVAGRLTAAKE